MKKFTTQEIRDLFGQVVMGEISFSRMAEIMNEMVSEEEKPNFKEGEFLHSDWSDEGITIIFKNQEGDKIYYHASKSCYYGAVVSDNRYWRDEGDFRYATEEEKQELLDALAKAGKRWNAEKKCIEDIPKRKFKKGDKVRIKHGVSNKTHYNVAPAFLEDMDDLIGKTMTVDRYTDGGEYVACEETKYDFSEDWLEPYEELKKGDLAIFWDNNKKYARINIYDKYIDGCHRDIAGYARKNAIKFESKEQYERFIKGEI